MRVKKCYSESMLMMDLKDKCCPVCGVTELCFVITLPRSVDV
jgi:hypothetical protein